MKSFVRYSVALAAVLAFALGITIDAAATTPAAPTTPDTTPSNPPTYPSLLALTLEVSADTTFELRTLRDLTITAQGETDYAPAIVVGPINPFTSENACARPMPEGITGCVVNDDATVGTLRVNWRVPEAGTYRFVLSGKRGASDRLETIGAFELEARD